MWGVRSRVLVLRADHRHRGDVRLARGHLLRVQPSLLLKATADRGNIVVETGREFFADSMYLRDNRRSRDRSDR
jgi:hypothetical protein